MNMCFSIVDEGMVFVPGGFESLYSGRPILYRGSLILYSGRQFSKVEHRK